MPKLKDLKIRDLAYVAIALVCVSGAIFVVSSAVTSNQIRDSQRIWKVFAEKAKAQALTAIVTQIGFGGMIHHFKNIVLRKNPERIRQFQSAAGGVMAAIDQYAATGPSPREEVAINALRSVVNAYVRNLQRIKDLAAQGRTTAEIDQIIKVDDRPALDAIKFLKSVVRAHRDGAMGQTKMELVGEIHAALGYGGMIHNFKNFVLRKDERLISRFNSDLERLQSALRKFRMIGMAPAEKDALSDVIAVTSEYQKNLLVARKLALSGKAPDAIDRLVKVNDRPALDGLAKLVSIIGYRSVDQGEKLSASLEGAAEITEAVLVVAVLTAILLTLLIYVIVFRQIIRPIANIEHVMTDLAQGDLGVALPATHQNEIGDMMQAVQVFRQTAIENERLTARLLVNKQQLEDSLENEKEMAALQRQFVSTASHEFRTPLAIIDSSAQRVARKSTKGQLTADSLDNHVGKIRNAVARMARLMESTLAAARMEEGKIELEFAPCDIRALVRDVCSRQREISSEHNINWNLAELPGTVRADRDAVEQMLTNLLSNAVKYSPHASGIDVFAKVDGDQVAISVKDQGIGIDADELARVGTRFFRARTSTGIEGTGIGLNLVRDLVERHGGSMDVESIRGSGSTFTIRLPIDGPSKSSESDHQEMDAA